MRAILIDPSERTCHEHEYDPSNTLDLLSLLDCDQLSSRTMRTGEVVLFGADPQPRMQAGFVMPLPKGALHAMGKALIVGVVGGRSTDTALTPTHVARGLFWVRGTP